MSDDIETPEVDIDDIETSDEKSSVAGTVAIVAAGMAVGLGVGYGVKKLSNKIEDAIVRHRSKKIQEDDNNSDQEE